MIGIPAQEFGACREAKEYNEKSSKSIMLSNTSIDLEVTKDSEYLFNCRTVPILFSNL